MIVGPSAPQAKLPFFSRGGDSFLLARTAVLEQLGGVSGAPRSEGNIMTKLNSNRLATDVELTETMIDEVVSLIPIEKILDTFKQVVKPVMLLAASIGIADTATLAEIVGAARLDGEANPGIGYDVTIPGSDEEGHVEIKTRGAVKNKSAGVPRDEQKVTIRLSPSQREKADHLFLTVIADNAVTNKKITIYFMIPCQAMTAKAFDIRFNKEGCPVGKYAQYAFSDKSESKARLKSTPAIRLEDAMDLGDKDPIPSLKHIPVDPGKIIDIFGNDKSIKNAYQKA